MSVVERRVRRRLELHLSHPAHGLYRGRRMDVVEERRCADESFVSDELLGVDASSRLLEGNVPLAGNLSERVIDRHGLQVAAEILLAFQRFEQRLEVSGAEAFRALSLNDLVEERRTVLHRLRENLKQISLFVAIDEDAQVSQPRHV